MHFTLVRQRGYNDCGVAALATIANFHGIVVDYISLGNALDLGPDGTDLLPIARAAKGIGLHTQGVEAPFEALRTCPLPAIAQFVSWLGTRHFVIVVAWAPKHVVIGDPADGLSTLSRRAFLRRHSGYLLLLRPWTR